MDVKETVIFDTSQSYLQFMLQFLESNTGPYYAIHSIPTVARWIHYVLSYLRYETWKLEAYWCVFSLNDLHVVSCCSVTGPFSYEVLMRGSF